ncbi:hypothetical protein M2283_009343 [Streptomyces pseudovenezuelae]|uniref:Uncharacterized protein n=1 Tax=Streptomyces pseudovenezuelae TaxID=67350 RepID=A0ABT6M1X9_9ACTN|nr:hypothetical protein [Streptomyces pseudovenezuelae]
MAQREALCHTVQVQRGPFALARFQGGSSALSRRVRLRTP